MNLFTATLKSDNSVFIQLALDLGPDKVAETAVDMGIKRRHVHGYPAESLGGLERGVSPLEMATAYATIASGGYRNRPTAITKVTFEGTGRSELPRRWRPHRTKVFPDGVTYEATKILEANIQGGTGTHANIGCPAGGKTGTTDLNTDAWFVGFTPRLATAVWVGYPNDRTQMNGLYFGRNVDGGTFPADIWGEYMKSIKGSYCGAFRAAQGAVRLAAVLRRVLQQRRQQARPRQRRGRARSPTDDDDARTSRRQRHRRRQPGRRHPVRPRPVRVAAAGPADDRADRPGHDAPVGQAFRTRSLDWYKPRVRAAGRRREHAGRQCLQHPSRIESTQRRCCSRWQLVS